MLLLLDTAGLYFRAFHALPTTLRAPDGTPVNAVRGLLDTLARLVDDRRPDALAACWDDDWRPAFRVAAWPGYKAHRVAGATSAPTGGQPGGPGGGEAVPAELTAQLPVIVATLTTLGVPPVGAPGHEADDVIATLATQAGAAGERVEIVTGDRDLLALVDDARGVRVLFPRGGRAGGGGVDVYDDAAVRARYGVAPAHYPDFAVLRGDPSDGLPGVAGIGEKTAARLIGRYGDLGGVLAAADDPASGLTPAVRAALREAAGYLAVAPRVVRLVRDAPLTGGPSVLPVRLAQRQRASVAALRSRWGLGGSLDRAVAALTTPPGGRQATDE